MSARLAILYVALFSFVGVYMPFWPAWLKSRGLDAEQIAAIMLAATWIRIGVAPWVTAYADRRGERKTVIVKLAVGALVCYALFPWVDGFAWLMTLTIATGIVSCAINPLSENLTLLATRNHGLDYGRIRLWGSLAFIVVAMGVGRALNDLPDRFVPWLVIAAMAAIVSAAAFLPDEKPPRAAGRRGPIRLLLANPTFVLFIATAAVLQSSHAVYYIFGTLHWRAAGLSDAWIGWFWAEGVIAEIVLFWFGVRVAKRVSPVAMFAIAAAAGLVRWSLLAVTADIWALFLIQALHGLTFGAAHLAAMNFLMRAIPSEYSASAQGLLGGLALGVAMGASVYLAGHAYAAYGGHAYFAMTAISALGGILLVVFAWKWTGGEIIRVEAQGD